MKNALHANNVILFCNEDFDKVTFIANQRHIIAAGLYKVSFDNDNNFDEDYPDTIVHIRLLPWHGNFKKRKALEKI